LRDPDVLLIIPKPTLTVDTPSGI